MAKTYRVTVRPQVNEEQLTRMSTGVVIDGRKTAPAKVRVLQQEQGRVVLEIVLYEGRNGRSGRCARPWDWKWPV